MQPAAFRSSCLEMFYKKGVLKSFAKFTEKHQGQSLYFNEAAGLRLVSSYIWKKVSLDNFKTYYGKKVKIIIGYQSYENIEGN